jgi:hypothetical protein
MVSKHKEDASTHSLYNPQLWLEVGATDEPDRN